MRVGVVGAGIMGADNARQLARFVSGAEVQAWVDAIGGADRGPLATAYDGLVASAVAATVLNSMRSDGARVRVEVPKVPGASA